MAYAYHGQKECFFANVPKVLIFRLLAGTMTINDIFVEGVGNRLLRIFVEGVDTLTSFKQALSLKKGNIWKAK